MGFIAITSEPFEDTTASFKTEDPDDSIQFIANIDVFEINPI